jgi:hypothetical protein
MIKVQGWHNEEEVSKFSLARREKGKVSFVLEEGTYGEPATASAK